MGTRTDRLLLATVGLMGGLPLLVVLVPRLLPDPAALVVQIAVAVVGILAGAVGVALLQEAVRRENGHAGR